MPKNAESSKFNAATYIEQASHLLGLTIDPEHYLGVVENIEVLEQVAELVMSFPLTETFEAAPVFNPQPPSKISD